MLGVPKFCTMAYREDERVSKTVHEAKYIFPRVLVYRVSMATTPAWGLGDWTGMSMVTLSPD